VAAGADAIKFAGVVTAVVLPALAAPIVAGLASMTATFLAYRTTARTRPDVVARGYKRGQVVAASMVSLAHGTNDAQKTMGVITLALITAGALPAGSAPPTWVIVAAGLAIALGTYCGGWRIIRNLGKGLYDMQPAQGFCADTASTVTILVSSHLGFALSTTQVPSAALVGALASGAAGEGMLGTLVVGLVAVAVALGLFIASRRRPVTARNVTEIPSAVEPLPQTVAA
jgi:PiT family inorganic phosphate transporter